MNSHRFEDAAKSIFALCPGITAADENGRFAIEVIFLNQFLFFKIFEIEFCKGY